MLEGCFWKSVTALSQADTQASVSNIYTVRIPLEVAGADFAVSHDDIVILGECTDEISNEKGFRAAEVLSRHKPDAFKVTATADNTGHLMDKHYRLGG